MERKLTHIALFAALIAALGLVPRFEIFPGLAITAQSMGVMLCGTILGARIGGLAALLFVALMSLGLPIWAGGIGGPGIYATAKAGFVIGYPIAAFCTGLVMAQMRGNVAVGAFAASVIGGMVVLYACGIPGMAFALGKTIPEASVIALAFIPGDLVKAVLVALVTQAVARARPGILMSRA